MKISILIDEITTTDQGETLRALLHGVAEAFADYSGEARFVVQVNSDAVPARAILEANA